VGTVLTLLALLSCTTAPPPRPNVLLVTMDTTRADALGVYGNTQKPTPNLDEFSGSAVRFTRAQTVTPLTIPTHSSIFTGLWPPRHGVRDNGDFFLGEGAVTLAERLHDQGYATMASVGAEVTSHHWGFSQGFDAFFDDMGQGARDQREKNRWRVERRGDAVLADAMPWLQAQTPEKPWFAWVHLFDAHHPYEAPEPYASKYPNLPYLAEVAYVDALVGQLLDDLEARGELDRTWVILMADHGEGLGSHGEMMHGVLLYDATTRVPLLIRPPGGRKDGRTVDFPVSVVDITPTVLGAVGLPAAEGVDGIDLGPWIAEQPAAAPARDVYVESLYAFHHYGWAPQRALVAPDHKLIDSTHDELYAATDFLELKDLSDTETAAAGELAGRLESLAAGMTPLDDASARVELSADRLAQLEALGYVTGGDAPTEAPAADLPDPVDRLPVLRKVELARQAFQRGDLDGARKRAEEVVAEEPGLMEAKMLLASTQLRAGDPTAALATIEEVHRVAPSSNSWAMMASIQLQTGNADLAEDAWKEALAIDPYLSNAWVPYLHLLFAQARIDTLLSESERAMGLLPDEPMVLALHGIALTMTGDRAGGRAELERSLVMDPDVPLSNHGLGVLARVEGDADRAEQLLLEEVRLHPPALASRRVLVEIYAEQSRYQEQLEQLSVIGPNEPANPLTLHSTAQALFNLQRYEDAAPVVAACRAQFPAYSGCAVLDANVLKKLGRAAEAEAAWKEAQALREAELASGAP
jgi:arylsulfatase A-like enzyme/Tfp pilus assembly protein PilF